MTGADIAIEILFYLLFTVIAATVLFMVVAFVLFIYRVITRTKTPSRPLRRFALLLGAVIVIGLPVDFLWVFLFSGRWYLDRDHVYGFSPLAPFQLDTQCGDQFIGNGSYLTMEAAWLVLAGAVWFIAIKSVQKLSCHKTTSLGHTDSGVSR